MSQRPTEPGVGTQGPSPVRVPDAGPISEPSGAAIGWITFAGVLMIVAGSFQIIAGLAALINPDSFTAVDSIFEQIRAKAIHGFGATVSAIAAFVWLPIRPIWGILVIAVDLAVIWALTAHGRDIQKAERM